MTKKHRFKKTFSKKITAVLVSIGLVFVVALGYFVYITKSNTGPGSTSTVQDEGLVNQPELPPDTEYEIINSETYQEGLPVTL